ncbi:MAG: DUF2274 domain-containing protein [Inquilinus sp.]|uniref:DUF2274 domain-containing protein n=1 Tax=Inquilinus sp. TaxID=1932117 RepID=UPI003F3E00F5
MSALAGPGRCLVFGALQSTHIVWKSRLTVELPAALHRDLVAYAELLSRETGQAVEPVRLIVPMLARFMAADRGFSVVRALVRSSSVLA